MIGRVFVSYARTDQEFALRLAGELKDRGVAIWLDQWDIAPGADWDLAIDQALRHSETVIAVLSPSAVESRQVRAETNAAMEAGKTILYKDCEVPRVLRLYQIIDFRDDQQHANMLDRLVAALGGIAPTSFPPQDGDGSPSNSRLASSASRGLPHIRQIKAGISRRFLVFAGAATAAVLVAVLLLGDYFAPGASFFSPAPGPVGTLQVYVNVDAARVSVDGAQAGIAHKGTPLILRGVAAGQHRIRVEADGYWPQDRALNVSPDEWSTAGFTLREKPRSQ